MRRFYITESAHFAYDFERLTEARPESAPAKFGSRVIANDYGVFLPGGGLTARWRGSLSVRELIRPFGWPSFGPSTVSFRRFRGFMGVIQHSLTLSLT